MNNSRFKILNVFSSCLYSIAAIGCFAPLTLGYPNNSSSYSNSISLSINDSPKEVIDQVWQIIYRDYMDSNGNYNSNEWLKKILRHILIWDLQK